MKYLKIIILIVIIILLYLYLPRHSWVEQDVINELNNNYIYIPNRKSDDYFKDIIFKEQQVWKYELSEQEMKEINEYIDNGNFVRLTEDSFDYLKLWWYGSYSLVNFDFRIGFKNIDVDNSYRCCVSYRGNYAEFVIDASNYNYYILIYDS